MNFEIPYIPPTIPVQETSEEKREEEIYGPKLSQLFKTPVIEQNPYGGPPLIPLYTSRQIYTGLLPDGDTQF